MTAHRADRRYVNAFFVCAVLAGVLTACTTSAKDGCVPALGRIGSKVESQCVQLTFQGKARSYRVYAPRTPTKGPMPLLLVLHGGSGSGSGMEGLTLGQFNRIADKQGVIIAYPDGIGRSWNDGRSDVHSEAVKEHSDDVGFLKAVVEDIGRRLPLDRKRVYATGISNGGFMSFRLACDASDVVAAVAPVAANLTADLAPRCHPARMPAIAIINGVEDPLVPWKGGDVKVLWSHRGAVFSAPDTFNWWVKSGGCGVPEARPPGRTADDGTSVVEHVAGKCRDGGEVRLYEVRGGGHNWPGGRPYLSEHLVGKVSHAMNASEEIWEFVSRFSLP